MNNNATLIEDLAKIYEIEDDNLIIVEDKEDTKKANISDLKRSLSGDYTEPSENKFYSSAKTNSLFDNIKRLNSTFATNEKLDNLSKRVEDIIASAGNGIPSEVVDARDGETTLNNRLERDLIEADDKFISKVHRVIEGAEVSTGSYGIVNVRCKNTKSNNITIIGTSKNMISAIPNDINNGITSIGHGFKYQQKNTDKLFVSYKLKNIPKGKYYFFADVIFDNQFKDRNIKFAIVNSNDDSAYTEFDYDQSSKFIFEAPKAFNEIRLIFNKDNFVQNASVTYNYVMLMKDDKYEDIYVDPKNVLFANSNYTQDTVFSFYNKDYDITCSDPYATLVVDYYDDSITIESMSDDIKEIQNVLLNDRDKCGLIENYGSYLFFDNTVSEVESACRISYDKDKFMRNGKPSLKLTFQKDSELNPILTTEMTEYIKNIESVSLVFYIDRTVSYYFEDEQPIRIALCGDSYNEPEMVNYFTSSIRKDQLIQGWNIVKIPVSNFASVGNPNIHNIKYTKIEIVKNVGLDEKTIYLNSIVFNQRMKPTVLFAFDGLNELDLSDTFLLLQSNNIPATVLANASTTFGSLALNKFLELKTVYGWDIGQYGCKSNKEKLTFDDNSREQYLKLKDTKEWLQNNLVYNPISYSAPYGNLRPITIPLLKDLGYKIAKTKANTYCNFFDPKYDFAIPMYLFSNETLEEEIKEKIQYAIDNNCCICIYINSASRGDSSAEHANEAYPKLETFKSVVKFINENRDKINLTTFADFYNKCNS